MRLERKYLGLVSNPEILIKKISFSSRTSRFRGQNSRSRLESWDWERQNFNFEKWKDSISFIKMQEISEDGIRVLTRPLEATFTFTLLTQCPVPSSIVRFHYLNFLKDFKDTKGYGNRRRFCKHVSHGMRHSFWLVKIKFFIYYSCCGWSHWPKSKPNSSKGDWVTYLYFHEILLKTSCVLNVWAENKGRHPSTKVHFFQHSSRSRLEAREWRQKFSISSRSMRPKGRNSRSRLETWDWREEILDLVSKHETERKKFSISSRELK